MREGMRESEALSLTWECVDLKRGAIRLDKNKTDDPRSWALDAGVARALRVYRECFPSDASASGLVFVSPNGEAISKLGLAELLRGSPRDRVREPRLFHGMCRKLELAGVVEPALAKALGKRTGRRRSRAAADFD